MLSPRTIPGVYVLSESTPKMILLRITSDIAVQRLKDFVDWTLHESRTVALDICPSHDLVGAGEPPLKVIK